MQPSNGMANDDVYLNDGETFQNGIYYPEVPEEQRAAEQTEAALTASSYPILDDIRDWFKGEIAECDNIHQIQVSKMTVNGVSYSRTVSVEAQVLAMQLLKEKLQEKLHKFDIRDRA